MCHPFPGCSRGDDSAESGGGGAGSSPRSEEGGVPMGVRGHTSSASVKSESPASPLPHGLHTPAHQVQITFHLYFQTCSQKCLDWMRVSTNNETTGHSQREFLSVPQILFGYGYIMAHNITMDKENLGMGLSNIE